MEDDIIVMETERLVLREFLADDLDALMLVLSDPETMIHYPQPFDQAGVERWIERSQRSYRERGFGLYAVCLRETTELIGDCGFITQEVDGRLETELGYHIGRVHWNRGYATEAARACRDYAFDTLLLDRFISLIRPVNVQSRRVAEKTGLSIEKEAVFRGAQHYVYSIAKPR